MKIETTTYQVPNESVDSIVNAIPYTCEPLKIHEKNKVISDFMSTGGHNIDSKVVEDFGEEWSKFNDFDDGLIRKMGDEYFDILPSELCNKRIKVMDMGCGTGRWTKYLASKVGFIDAVDPSKAIFVADGLLKDTPNVRLTKATSEALPFKDNSYDLVISVGVLHHIPDTLQAMKDCVSKVKHGGYFYTYLYYNLDNRGFLFKTIFAVANAIRKMVSSLPGKIKKIVCDVLAIVFYMPFVLLSRAFYAVRLTKAADKVPLAYYRNKSFFVIRNDALDRFGTRLEQRFSKEEIEGMMRQCGLSEICFSNNSPYWHVIGRKI
jgi:ubiquinone/menaquinone biosynthesis C-methylase UbiE